MRRAYLYDQPLSDAVQMGFKKDEAFLDLPTTRRQALYDLVDGGGLKGGDVLVVSARSKLGRGQAANRIAGRLRALGVTLEVIDVVSAPPRARGKRRAITDAERTYCRAVWHSTSPPDDALVAISNKLRFPVDRNWCNYNLGPRGGSTGSEKEGE